MGEEYTRRREECQSSSEGFGRRSRNYADFLAAPTGSRFESGTRNIVLQCWQRTSLPRASSGNERILRQRRLGQINWQGIAVSPIDLSANRQTSLNRFAPDPDSLPHRPLFEQPLKLLGQIRHADGRIFAIRRIKRIADHADLPAR